MIVFAITTILILCISVLAFVLRYGFASATAQARLAGALDWQLDSVATDQPRDAVPSLAAGSRNPLRRPFRYAPYAVGLGCSILLLTFTSIPSAIAWSAAPVVALLLAQLEGMIHEQKAAKIEQQMIDLLDMMIPMLRSGAGAMVAMSTATEQIQAPMQQQISWCVRRIQLGDRGTDVFRKLSQRIPSDVVELFCTTMAVHGETGGSLAPILVSVNRVARDRQEIARRIRSNIAQSQFSTVAVLCLIYFVAAILWFDRPDQVEAFVTSEIGSIAVAGTVVLQAVGIMWMNTMSKPKS